MFTEPTAAPTTKRIIDYINENAGRTIVLHPCQNPNFMIRLTINECRVVDKVERATTVGEFSAWEETFTKTLVRWMADEALDPVGQQWIIIPTEHS